MRFPSGDQIVRVVVPCLDEEEAIGPLIEEILAVGVDEVIVVDNGSSDRTAEVARAAGARVVHEPRRGYGRACAAGVAALPAETDIVCFLDGDGSDVPAFIPEVVGAISRGRADFVMGSRLTGRREAGSMTPQQLIAGRIAGLLIKFVYGVAYTDMSPFRAIRPQRLVELGMTDRTYGWNLEMQMRAAARGLRVFEPPVDHRRRRGGASKVSGNPIAGVRAAVKITTTFLRLWRSLERPSRATAPIEAIRGDIGS